MKAPDLPHGTLNSCFIAFCTIWMHLGPLGCLMKLWAKRAELVQKFVPRSQVGFFCDEHTQSTPLDLNSCFGKFHSVWIHLLSFRNYTKLGAKWSELVQSMQKFVPQSHVGIFRHKRIQSTPLDHKLMFWCIL